jgi:molybdenum ABC transporter molybdate-binding protein
MKRSLIVLCLLLAFAVTALVWFSRSRGGPLGNRVTVYCAAGLKKPVEAAAAAFQRECGIAVNLQYGGTGTLLSQLRATRQGDLFIAADAGSLADARRTGSIREVLPVAVQHPVVAVRSGNPKNIRNLADLLRDDVRVALANPEAASIGRTARTVLGEQWQVLASRAAVMKPTVMDIASDLNLGAVDAAIVWDSTPAQFKGIEAVEVPELGARAEDASVAVLDSSAQVPTALRFARYLAAPEKGGKLFKDHGFTPAGGDSWEERPAFVIYSGGVNRPAIAPLLDEFAAREGIEITTVFNGCGILCAAMQTMQDASNPKFPDAYYACDVTFVPPVAAHFPQFVVLTETPIGIVVPKGNPRAIRTLADLARPHLRVGICNAAQSTLGYLTKGLLVDSGHDSAVRRNVAVEVPTADFLINQLRANGLEAAIVYQANATTQAAHLDFVPIKHPGARAAQPFSICEDSPRARTAGRLLDFLKTRRKNFEDAGFVWRGDGPTLPSKEIKIPAWLGTADSANPAQP